MRILIEAYDYPLDILKEILPHYLYQINPSKADFAKTLYVGYYNNGKGNSCLILPKIFLISSNNTILHQIDVLLASTQSIDFFLGKGVLHLSFYNYLLKLSIDLYKSFEIYSQNTNRYHDLQAINNSAIFLKSGDLYAIDILAIVLALFQCFDDNKHTFFKIKKEESAHTQKINWHKTLQNKTPFFQANAPIYWEASKEKQGNVYNIPLYNLFFQVLHLCNENYTLQRKDIPQVQDKIPIQNALKLLYTWQGLYTNALDKQILNLLLAYFEKTSHHKAAQKPYFFLCTHYEYVFEAMIDNLLSTPSLQNFKQQKDGGIIDHLFEYKALLGEGKSFYIADAKYYKESTQYSTYTQYKQYVYARNLLQEIIDKKLIANTPCSITEAYLPIGNIFLQAHIEDWQNSIDNLKTNALSPFQKTAHFSNRFFDRDTLMIVNLQLNYNFILAQYLQNTPRDKSILQAKIRSYILDIYAQHYDIYILQAPIDILQFIDIHYKKLQGKIALPNLYKNQCLLVVEKDTLYTSELSFLQAFLLPTTFHNTTKA